jgi:hypothetical protein
MSNKIPADHEVLYHFAWDEYQRVGFDLPHYGNGHYDGAHDHVTDRMYEKFCETHPTVNFRQITRKALGNIHDDRKETRANEAKQNRRWAAAEKAKNAPPKAPRAKKEPEPWWKKAGYSVPMQKPRKGIGSH